MVRLVRQSPEVLPFKPELYSAGEAVLAAAEELCGYEGFERYLEEREKLLEETAVDRFSGVWDRFLPDGTCLTVLDVNCRPDSCRFLVLDPAAEQPTTFEQPVAALAYVQTTAPFAGPEQYEPTWYFGEDDVATVLRAFEEPDLSSICTYEDIVRESLHRKIYERQQHTFGYALRQGRGYLIKAGVMYPLYESTALYPLVTRVRDFGRIQLSDEISA